MWEGGARSVVDVNDAAAGSAPVEYAVVVFGLDDAQRAVVEHLLAIALGGRPNPTIGQLVESLASEHEIEHVLDAIDPAGLLFARELCVAWGGGPWLRQQIGLADSFWPRLRGHWPRSVPRATAPDGALLDRLSLGQPARTLSQARGVATDDDRPAALAHGPSWLGTHLPRA